MYSIRNAICSPAIYFFRYLNIPRVLETFLLINLIWSAQSRELLITIPIPCKTCQVSVLYFVHVADYTSRETTTAPVTAATTAEASPQTPLNGISTKAASMITQRSNPSSTTPVSPVSSSAPGFLRCFCEILSGLQFERSSFDLTECFLHTVQFSFICHTQHNTNSKIS